MKKGFILGIGVVICLMIYRMVFAVPVVGKAILQNTTDDDLDVYYSLCTAEYVGATHQGKVCGFPLKLHLAAKTSNFQNPLAITINNKFDEGTFEIMAINDLKTGRKENLEGTCQTGFNTTYNALGIITFSTLIDDSNIINCSIGSARK